MLLKVYLLCEKNQINLLTKSFLCDIMLVMRLSLGNGAKCMYDKSESVRLSDISKFTDKELLAPCEFESASRFSESERIAELISRYTKTIFASASKYKTFADYEELVSDGMQALLKAIRGYDSSKGEFSTFAAVCIENGMRNTAKRSMVRSSRIADSENSLEELDRLPDPSPTPEDIVIQREDEVNFFSNLKTKLSELELRCIEGIIMGLSYDDIAGYLSVDRKSVDNALTRARAKLRRLYK